MTGSKIGGEKHGPRRWRYLIDIVVLVAVTFLLDAVVGAFLPAPIGWEKGFVFDAIGKMLLVGVGWGLIRLRGERAAVTSTDLSLRAMLIWEKTLPDCFVGITGFAFGIPLPHGFQCKQSAIATGIERAHCGGNVCQPWRRRFFFELFECSLPRPIQLTHVDEAHAVEHIPHCA